MNEIYIKNKIGNSILEYAIIIGITALALTTMNIYIKRGIQGKLKDMTDNFIGREQIGEINPTAVINSSSRSLSNAALNNELFIAGGSRLVVNETANMTATSRVVDTGNNTYTSDFIPAEEGEIISPVGSDRIEVDIPPEEGERRRRGGRPRDRDSGR